MNTLTLRAPAKINLALDILGKDPSGYHFVETILYEMPSLADTLVLEKKKIGTSVEWHGTEKAPSEKENLAYRAAHLFFERTKIIGGVKIKIDKKIPLGAGFGGGSSDAAATLKGLNALYATNLSVKTLRLWSTDLGMDVPFFITGGTAYATHFGEKITPLPPARLPPLSFTTTNQKVHTRSAYALVDLALCGKRTHDTQNILNAILSQKPVNLAWCHNDFDSVFAKLYPKISLALGQKRVRHTWLTGASTTLLYESV